MGEALGKHNVLIVDDLASNVKTLAEILKKDYTVTISLSGEEALEIVEGGSVDIVLLDIIMPELDGYEVCQRIKETEIGKKIPIIFVTVLSESLDEVKALSAGAVDFITKPVHAPSVRAKVKNHLEMVKILKTVEEQAAELKEVTAFREEMNHLYQTNLQGPLDRIISLINHLNWTTDPSDAQVEILQSILKQAYKFSNLLNFSINLFNIRKDEYRFMPKPFNFISLIDDLLLVEKDLIEASNIPVRVLVHGRPRRQRDSFSVDADVSLCYSILNVLIINAVESSPAGDEVTIFLETVFQDGKNYLTIKVHTKGLFVHKSRSLNQSIAQRKKQDKDEFDIYAIRLMTEVQRGIMEIEASEEFGTTVKLAFMNHES